MNTQVVGFKKIKFHTHENVGAGNLTLPEQEMHTTAWWLTLPHEMLETLPYAATDRQDGVRALGNALQAMAILLVMCDGRDLGVAVGENSRGGSQESEARKQKEGRSSVVGCQLSVEAAEHSQDSKIENGAQDSTQRTTDHGPRAAFDGRQRTTDNGPRTVFEPNIYLYDKYPGGIGLSEPLYRMSERLLNNARKLIENCHCESGCPSCVGPVGEIGEKGKEVALAILGVLREGPGAC